jgi:L-ribulokinase
MTSVKAKRFDPDPAAHAVYDRLFALYSTLHDAFGGVSQGASDLGSVMKSLLSIRDAAVGPVA